jgi:acyl carrier protein
MSPEGGQGEISKERVEREVREYLLQEFLPGRDPSSLTPDTELMAQGLLDSISVIRLVAYLEETYGVELEPHEYSADFLGTTALIAETVTGKRG